MADGPRADDRHGQALAAAAQHHAAGDSGRALELLPALVAARPDDIEVRLLLARCLATAGAPAVALAAAEVAVDCDATSWEAHALLARAALPTEPERAAAAAERAIRLAPHEPDAVRVHAAVRTAREATAATADASSGSGFRSGLGSALGRRPSALPVEPARPEPPREPRLPATLDPAHRPDLPAAHPAPTAPPLATTSAPAGAGERDLPVPVGLGGSGLGHARVTPDRATDGPGPVRMGFRIVGLVFWMLLAVRIGPLGIGGPVGVAVLLAGAAAVTWGARQVRTV